MSDILVAAGAVLLIILTVGWLLHWYVVSAAWWPLVGPEWRNENMLICWGCGRFIWSTLLWDQQGTPRHRRHRIDLPGPVIGTEITSPAGESSPDDEWADQLHAINQLGKLGDLTRPVALLTHYEIEAVIRGLGVPDWLPERWRLAA